MKRYFKILCIGWFLTYLFVKLNIKDSFLFAHIKYRAVNSGIYSYCLIMLVCAFFFEKRLRAILLIVPAFLLVISFVMFFPYSSEIIKIFDGFDPLYGMTISTLLALFFLDFLFNKFWTSYHQTITPKPNQ
ncbi:MAG: hypothetical protein C4K58_02175 [Flavobacteriaceae bacterium]|nr:MAG: hypothetical protein C4K58_02175 [Flavobacteriaceae bacterium]